MTPFKLAWWIARFVLWLALFASVACGGVFGAALAFTKWQDYQAAKRNYNHPPDVLPAEFNGWDDPAASAWTPVYEKAADQKCVRLIRKPWPHAYDDLDDATLFKKVETKHPGFCSTFHGDVLDRLAGQP
jgi:hypothetical protein